MPYPNEHALRLQPPGIFDPDTFRTTAGGTLFGGKLKVPATINMIWAKLKGRAKPSDPPILQALRFKKASWTVSAAKSWISKNIKQKGTFEPAKSTTGKAEDISSLESDQEILFGDYDAYDGAEAVKFEEVAEYDLTLDDIEDDADPETEAARQFAQLKAAYQSGIEDAGNGQEDDTTEEYAAAADGDTDSNTEDIGDVEVMAVGTWNNDKYTTQDLDLIARNFPLLRHMVKPPLVLGHGEDGEKLLQASGLPAAGWVSKLRRVGDKLLADFSDVPRAVAEIIKNRGYKRVSVEVYPNYQAPNGKRFGLALARIALLGTAIPAIKTLKDIEALYSGNLEHNKTKEVVYMAAKDKDTELTEETEELVDEEEEVEEEEVEEAETAAPSPKPKDDTPPKTEDQVATPEAVSLSEFRETQRNFQELQKKFSASNQVITVLQEQLKEQANAAALAANEKFLDSLIAEGKFPPAVRSKALRVMEQLRQGNANEPVKYTELDEEGKEVEKEATLLAMFQEMMTDLSVTIDMAETSAGTPADKPGRSLQGRYEEQYAHTGYEVTGGETVDEVMKLVEKLRPEHPTWDEHKLYSEALIEVERSK